MREALFWISIPLIIGNGVWALYSLFGKSEQTQEGKLQKDGSKVIVAIVLIIFATLVTVKAFLGEV